MYSMTEMRRLGYNESTVTRFSQNRAFISCHVINLIIYNTASQRTTVYDQKKLGHSDTSLSSNEEMALLTYILLHE